MSTDSDWKNAVGSAVMTGKIIVAALATGPTIFLLIVLFLTANGGPPDRAPFVTYAALAFAAVAIAMRMIVPAATVASGRRQIVAGTYRPGTGRSNNPGFDKLLERSGDAGLLFQLYLTKTIIAAALLEGATFFLLISYMMERQILSLAAAIVLIVGVALLMPTRDGVLAWIENQLAQVEQERQFK